jgi:hypothetical protein
MRSVMNLGGPAESAWHDDAGESDEAWSRTDLPRPATDSDFGYISETVRPCRGCPDEKQLIPVQTSDNSKGKFSISILMFILMNIECFKLQDEQKQNIRCL